MHWVIALLYLSIVPIFADTSFRAATVVITQNALSDAPERYATFLSQALEELQEQVCFMIVQLKENEMARSS